MQNRSKIKFCGIRSRESLLHALHLKVDYIGINLIKTSKRYADNYQELIDLYILNSDKTELVLVFQNEFLSKILDLKIKPIIQLHGQESAEYCQEIKNLGFKVWKVLVDTQKINDYSVDIFLFDSQNAGTGTMANVDAKELNNLAFNYGIAGGINNTNLEYFFNNFTKAKVFDIASGIEENKKYSEKMATEIINLRNKYGI